MRQHSGVLFVTEVLSIEQFALDTTSQPLPSLPTGDAGQNIIQITIRSVDEPWEWRIGDSGDYFWMEGLDIIVLPIRDRAQLEEFEFRAASSTADMRIIYEC